MSTNKVALAMIVKNESKVIRRCIESFSEIIDAVVLLDTGSNDDTLVEAERACQDLGLDFVGDETEWVDFGDARSRCLDLCRSTDFDVALMMDADWILKKLDGYDKDVLRTLNLDEAQAWNITIYDQGLEWPLPRITAIHHPWKYEDPVHEFLTDKGSGGHIHDTIPGVQAVHMADGGSRQGRHHRDVELLKGREDSRSKFYYAQSLFAIGDYENALEAYLLRAQMANGWAEEAYYSMYRAGTCANVLGRPEEAVGLYMFGWGMRLHRLECLLSAVEIWRAKNMWPLAYRFGREAVTIAATKAGLNDTLFVEGWRYRWGARWEYSVARMAGTQEYAEGVRALQLILDKEDLPENWKDATERNIEWGRKMSGVDRIVVPPEKTL